LSYSNVAAKVGGRTGTIDDQRRLRKWETGLEDHSQSPTTKSTTPRLSLAISLISFLRGRVKGAEHSRQTQPQDKGGKQSRKRLYIEGKVKNATEARKAGVYST